MIIVSWYDAETNTGGEFSTKSAQDAERFAQAKRKLGFYVDIARPFFYLDNFHNIHSGRAA